MSERERHPIPKTQATPTRASQPVERTAPSIKTHPNQPSAAARGHDIGHIPIAPPSATNAAEQQADRIAQNHGSAASKEIGPLARPTPSGVPLPPLVRQQIATPGQPLDFPTTARISPTLSGGLDDVRIHTGDTAAASARSVGAQAYTVGQHIVFGAGRYAPETTAGSSLLAHELAHVQQQTSSGITTLQRKMDEAQLAQAKAPAIMADETYMDNEIAKLEYFFGQEATVYYKDGAKLSFGLVPEYIKSPFEAIDFQTSRFDQATVETDQPNTFKYIPHATQITPAPGATLQDVIAKATETVHFKIESSSQRIVPTHVNSRTAPIICEMLRTCEAEYIRTTNEAAAGAIKVLKKLEIILMIYSLIPAGGAAAGVRGAAARGAGGAAAAGVAARAEATLVQEFLAILRAGGPKALTVEGVLLDGVRVFREGTVLVVRRFGIKRLVAEAGQGRVVQAAYERAAIEAAKQAGSKSVRILMEKPVNAAWKAYLESQGYTWQVFDKVGEVGVEGFMTKIIKL